MEVSEEPRRETGSLAPDVEIRPERPRDVDAIRTVVRDAFAGDFESIVVDRLRAGEAFIPELSLVAVRDGSIVGHVMVTRQDINRDDGSATLSTVLAPLAVAPANQGKGIGSALTVAALDAARSAGHASMVVIGHPAYYSRFGLKPASRWGIRYSSPIPDDVLMAVELVPGSLAKAQGRVTISTAFDET